MERMPSMPEPQWQMYLEWVAAYGSNASTKTRKLKQQLTSARDTVRLSHGEQMARDTQGLAYTGAHSGRWSGSSFTGTFIEEISTLTRQQCGLLSWPGKRS